MSVTPMDVVMLGALAVAAFTDFRTGLIPNALTFPVMAVGLAMNATLVPDDRARGLIGLLAAFALHFPLYSLGIQKAGDAKLLMAVGACAGWKFMLETTAWWAIVYVPVGLLQLAVLGRLPNLVATLRYVAARQRGTATGEPPEPTMLRTAPVIAVGGAMAYLTPWLDRLVG
jgi:preflagellin peptidase FlaK